MKRRGWPTAFGAGVLALACASAQGAESCIAGYTVDACDGDSDCRQQLEQDPYDTDARLGLCNALLAEGDLLEAMVVLREGLEDCGSRSYVCSQLEVALSNVEELAEKDTPDLRAQRRRQQAFKRQYCVGPSASDESIQACREALLTFGDDPSLYLALGTKYQQRGQAAEAVRNLTRAVALGADAQAANDSLERARQSRQELSRACLNGGDLDACDAAVLQGASDELALHERRAALLADRGRPEAALQAWLSAQALAPDDPGLARQALPSIDDALSDTPDDPELNGARAAALAALHRTDPAIVAYRRVLELNPQDAEAAARLPALRDRRRQELDAACVDPADIDACRNRIIAGEPDEQQLRVRVAALEEQRAREQQAREEEAREEAAALASSTAPAPATPPPAEAVALADTPAPDEDAVRTYDNRTAANGTTH